MAATEPYVRNQLYSIPLAELPTSPENFSIPWRWGELERITA